MTYMKPEMEIEKFDLVEEITGGSAEAGSDSDLASAAADSVVTDDTIGSDLIIG